ncbi:MAG: type II secretion system F family protein [Rubrimonas sp.]|uniref:type II secretion system F family protein n=1 Tax=Rubrimonas sp. TaxID=2036015 RepID=UPI002FDE6FFA
MLGGTIDVGGVEAPLAPIAAAAAMLLLMAIGAAIYLEVSARQAARRRIQLALGAAPGGGGELRRGERGDRNRRKQIETTLREMAEKQRARSQKTSRVSLAVRLRQSGLGWSKPVYVVVCVATAIAAFVGGVGLAGLSPALALAFAFAAGLLGPHLFVNQQRSKRMRVFLAELPDALDVIVRGVRSGLPLGDCLRIIATEGREPVRSEFRQLVDDMGVGLTINEAGERLFDRAPLLEVRLLGIILNIQNRSGGNLSEAIGNLSRVLRDRRKMKAKIKAISTEATASAAIIGSLPVVVAGLLYLTTPDYVTLLFTTQIGNIALAAGGVWMSIGVFVMRGMINFEV